MGRKRLPDHLKLLRGTARKGRMNPAAPAPDPDIPRAPDWLPKRACEVFGVLATRLESMGNASRSHTEMLAIAALRLHEVEACTALIEKKGGTYRTTNSQGGVMWRNRPEVAQRAEALRHLQSLLAEFGLSPASVGKVIGSPPGRAAPQDPVEKYFGDRGR